MLCFDAAAKMVQHHLLTIPKTSTICHAVQSIVLMAPKFSVQHIAACCLSLVPNDILRSVSRTWNTLCTMRVYDHTFRRASTYDKSRNICIKV